MAAFGGAAAEPTPTQGGPSGAPMSPARTFSVRHGAVVTQLATANLDPPNLGDEARMSDLHFVFSAGTGHLSGSANQLIVSDSGYYPGNLSTVRMGNALIRPIAGSLGVYAGATGSATTEHLLDST